jgi:putative transposase
MENTMADELRIGLQELLRKARMEHDADLLKEGVRVLSQALMEMEVEEHVGAARHERSPGRVGQRNGYRERSWDTRVGTVELKVPRVRDGGYFPSLLEPRRRAERALAAVVQEAYVHGVSTRKVDELVKALGMGGISKSRVSELCEELDEEVERFRGRPLEGFYPYVWVDATYVKARQDGRVASTAVVIAVGVNAETGEREVLGLDVGPSEDGAFWASFSALSGSQGALGGEAGHQRLSPRLEERRRDRLGRSLVAEVSGALHEERSLPGLQGSPTDGGGDHPHRLRPARCTKRPRAVA